MKENDLKKLYVIDVELQYSAIALQLHVFCHEAVW